MKSSLTIIKIILTVAIIVSIGTALGATVYFGVLKNNPPVAVQPTPTITQILTPTATLTPTPTITPNIDTSDWKTYRNEKFGYEIRYPKDWELIYLSKTIPGHTGVVLKSPKYQPIKDGNVIYDGEIYISIIDNPNNLGIKDLFNTFNDTGRFWFAKYDHKDTAINGNPGVLFDNVAEDTVSNIKRTSAYIQGEKKVIDVSYLFLKNPNREIYDKILSTFKFTEIANTADWKTYRNEKYGFEIKYPTQWNYNAVLENQIEFREKGKTYEIEGSDIYTVGIFIYDNTDNQTIKQMYETIKDNGGDTDKIKNLVIGNMDAIQTVDYLQENTILLRNNKIYNIATPEFGSQEIDKNVRSVYDKMLSTFYFIEK